MRKRARRGPLSTLPNVRSLPTTILRPDPDHRLGDFEVLVRPKQLEEGESGEHYEEA
jgi:hypothetical protein